MFTEKANKKLNVLRWIELYPVHQSGNPNFKWQEHIFVDLKLKSTICASDTESVYERERDSNATQTV